MAAPSPRAHLPGLALNPKARIEVRRIGREQQPVFIVDQALVDADAMVEFACSDGAFAPPAPGSLYPGRIAQLPSNYLPDILSALRRPLQSVFGYAPGPSLPAFGFYGLTTLPPAAMEPEQVIPHADAIHPHAYATVHFLRACDYGGTAFFRHRATGLEVVTPANVEACNRTRTAELEAHAGRPYAELQALYEEIAYIEPVFNRLILYRASQLHSAKLTDAGTLPDDPRTGRLTANLFFNVS
ncbi:MAG: hypothetical protein JF615_01370 [Asticcacaulis sp.]|nr:hypothetical protein [Asticcacaulis sp.]